MYIVMATVCKCTNTNKDKQGIWQNESTVYSKVEFWVNFSLQVFFNAIMMS